jgi:hypothetical protein
MKLLERDKLGTAPRFALASARICKQSALEAENPNTFAKRRETGRERVQVHCDEGVAIHIGPESCAGAREGLGEALTGGRTGQPLSRESFDSGCRHRASGGRQHIRADTTR